MWLIKFGGELIGQSHVEVDNQKLIINLKSYVDHIWYKLHHTDCQQI